MLMAKLVTGSKEPGSSAGRAKSFPIFFLVLDQEHKIPPIGFISIHLLLSIYFRLYTVKMKAFKVVQSAIRF